MLLKRSRELKTAFIVITGVVLFIIGYSFLKSHRLFDSRNTFYAVYNNVGGLQPGTTVSLRGKAIGKVESVDFINNYQELLVVLKIENDVQFSKNSSIQLFSSPLSGMGIQVLQKFDNAPVAKDGDTLITKKKEGLMDKLEPLQDNLDSAIGNADSLLVSFNDLLNENTKTQLQNTVASIERMAFSLEQSSKELNTLIKSQKTNLNQSMDNIANLSKNFSTISDSLAAAGLGQSAAELKVTVATLNQLIKGIEQGKGSLGKLANDEKLYQNLEGTTRQLELLLQDFRLNPKRYVNVSVFGKKQKAYNLPENDPADKEN